MHPNCSLPSLPPSLPQCSLPPSLPQIHCSSVSLQKGAGFPTISTEHGITRWNKLVTNPYNKTGKASQGNLVREKGFQEQTRVRNTPLPLLEVQHLKLNNHSMYVVDLLSQMHTGSVIASSVSVSPYGPCVVDSQVYVLLVSSAPLVLTIPPPVFCVVPSSFT